MPYAALKPCTYPGCSKLVKHGCCDMHRGEQVDRHNPEHQRLYDRKWQKRRLAWLSTHPWCEECLRGGAYVPATDVHHLHPHRGNREIFITSELESLCHECHSKLTLKEVRGRGAKNV